MTAPRRVFAAGAGGSVLEAMNDVDWLLKHCPPESTSTLEFLGAQFDAGLAWPHFPRGCGGLGLPRAASRQIMQRLRDGGVPDGRSSNPIGYGMAAPTLVAHGSPDQCERYLRRIFTGEDIWCQLFSEPGAGSDLASLATRAVAEGDEWSVTGHKVWISLAEVAHYGLLLARTDPEAEKHKGLTYFAVDLRNPGFEIRPLRHLTGEVEFSEVFLSDVRVADTERLGGVNDGWKTALSTLAHERVASGGASLASEADAVELAVTRWRTGAHDQRANRDRLLRLWVRAKVLGLTEVRLIGDVEVGSPAPAASVVKLARSELMQEIYSFCVDADGADGMLYSSYLEPTHDESSWAFLRSRSFTIGGGTSEIQRNVVAERALGLSPEERTDKGMPWSRVRRNDAPLAEARRRQ